MMNMKIQGKTQGKHQGEESIVCLTPYSLGAPQIVLARLQHIGRSRM